MGTLKKSRLVARVAMETVFEPGDFVRLKISPTGRVGVVSRVDPDSIASVQVCWHSGSGFSMTEAYQPNDLQLVPPENVPDHALALKRNLQL
jgi:uncharacterized protein YodC (DUF2158 family)